MTADRQIVETFPAGSFTLSRWSDGTGTLAFPGNTIEGWWYGDGADALLVIPVDDAGLLIVDREGRTTDWSDR